MSFVKINDFTITEFIDLEAYIRGTGELDFRLVDMQRFRLRAAQEKKALTGKNGRVIGYKKMNKSVSGDGTYGLISAGLMKAQTGGEAENGTHLVKRSEFVRVSGGTVTPEAAAVGTAGAEIGKIRALDSDGNVTASYEQAAEADATHFSYAPGTNKITLPVDGGEQVIADGTAIVFSYNRQVTGTKITDPSDKFSQVREIWIHCFGKDTCDREYYAAIYIPRADLSGSFQLDLGADQTVHDFSFDAVTDLCDTAKGKDLFELIVYTDD